MIDLGNTAILELFRILQTKMTGFGVHGHAPLIICEPVPCALQNLRMSASEVASLVLDCSLSSTDAPAPLHSGEEQKPRHDLLDTLSDLFAQSSFGESLNPPYRLIDLYQHPFFDLMIGTGRCP